jgi:hypothetical protein
MREKVVEDEYRIYVGIDWAMEAHQACVLDSVGGMLAERAFAHSGEAVQPSHNGCVSLPEVSRGRLPSRSRCRGVR